MRASCCSRVCKWSFLHITLKVDHACASVVRWRLYSCEFLNVMRNSEMLRKTNKWIPSCSIFIACFKKARFLLTNLIRIYCFCLHAAWQEVEQKLGDGDTEESTNSQGPVQYSEKTPSAAMKSKYMHLPHSTLIQVNVSLGGLICILTHSHGKIPQRRQQCESAPDNLTAL